MRAILTEAVQPPERVKLGSLLTGVISPANKLTDDEQANFFGRDRTPAEPMEFS